MTNPSVPASGGPHLGTRGGAAGTVLDALAQRHPEGALRHVERIAQREGVHAEWPDWVHPSLVAALHGAGVDRPWTHQVQAAEAAWAGRHIVLATGTASGKSLGYLVPVLSSLLTKRPDPVGRGATALYLAPTKALAADQLARVSGLALPGLRAATYDGDTSPDERRWIRDHATYVLTNPDLLHHSLLPGHARWSRFLRALTYVVVDECHTYRGVFGSHTALVLRRLRRVCAHYGATPTFVLASATVAEPRVLAGRLTGLTVEEVVEDGSSRPAMTIGLWEPPVVQERRRSAVSQSAELLADLVDHDVQTVAFARSRAGAEVIAEAARHALPAGAGSSGTIAAYRGGYLPEDRRELERSLRQRQIVGMSATSALELGIDIVGLDAVIVAGWPGTRSSFWQRVGRAGRDATPATAVFVADDDPLDSYLVAHPEAIFGRPVEASVVDPENPYLLAPHLAAAAAELPVVDADAELFGPTMPAVLESLAAAGLVRRRPTGWFWARPERPTDQVRLRGVGEQVSVVERGSGRVIGHVDEASACQQIHPGAVHLHQGSTYVVTELDLANRSALVVAGDPGWSTQARSTSDFVLGATMHHRQWGAVSLSFGRVEVTGQVVSFRRRLPSGEVLGEHLLDLPARTLSTAGVWWTVPEEVLAAAGVEQAQIPGAAHAAEHAAIALLPLIATADRWDIGGVSTACHPDTGLPTILVYDGHPGGAGFAERGFRAAKAWLTATREAVTGCGCQGGCPSCVQSPKCGNGNEPLSKPGAVALLGALLRDADADWA